MKILCVDDDRLFCDYMGDTLSQLGHPTHRFAYSGPKALEIIVQEREPFDCLLIDINMPGMDGIELVRRIRSLSAYRTTPIIMVSALQEKGYIDGAFHAGANDYVTKPLDRIELKMRLHMVQTILDGQAEARGLNEHLLASEQAVVREISFDEPLNLNDVRGLIPYTALENYVLKLGNMRLVGSCAIGFEVENAETIWSGQHGLQFHDAMADVAEAIGIALKDRSHLLSYAGAGKFVAVLDKTPEIVPEDLSLVIDREIEGFAAYYRDAGLMLPKVQVGTPVKAPLVALDSPARLLLRALLKIRRGRITPFGYSRFLSSLS